MADTLRVLYVDDDPHLLHVAKLYLERSGPFSVDTSGSARPPLQSGTLAEYDAIISDYEMPGMDGIQFLQEVRQRHGHLPFIIFTGRGREEIAILALNEGADFYLQKGGDPNAMFTELAHKVSIAVENRRAKETIHDNGMRYRSLIAVSNTGAWEYDNATGFLWCSPEYFSMIGRDISQFDMSGAPNLKETWIDLIHPDDRERAACHFQEYLQGGSEGMYENYFRMLDARGGVVWIWSRGRTLRDERGHLTDKTVGTHIDITRQKISEDEISLREVKYRSLFEGANDAILLILEGRIADCNAKSEQVYGITREQILGKAPFDLSPPFQPDGSCSEDRAWQRMRHALDGIPQVFEWTHSRPGGSTFDAEVSLSRVDAGNSVFVQAIVRDISERVRAQKDLLRNHEELAAAHEQITATEEELRQNLDELQESRRCLEENEQKFRRIVETANEGIWSMDAAFVTHFVNRKLADMLGYTTNEMLSRNIAEFMDPGEMQDHAIRVNNRKLGIHEVYERKFRSKDGSTRWFQISATPLTDAEGHFTGSFAMLSDITGQKQAHEELRQKNQELGAAYEQIAAAEEELRQNLEELTASQDGLIQSEAMYRTVFENTGTASVIIEEDGTISHANSEFARLCGIPRNQIEGTRKWTGFVYGEDLERMMAQHTLRRQDHDAALRHYEFRLVRSSGEIRDIRLSVDLIPGTKKSIASLMDVTDVRQAAAKQKESEQLYRSVLENIQDVFYRSDREGRLIMASPSWAVLLGYDSIDECLGQSIAEAFYFEPEKRDEFLQNVNTTGQVEDYEVTLRRKDGSPVIVATSSHLYYDECGAVLGVEGIFRDISERKEAEHNLGANRAFLENAMDLAQLAYWEYDVRSGIFTFNDRFYALYGTTPEREGGYHMPAEVYAREFVHPDDSHLVGEEIRKVLSTHDPDFTSEIEHRILRRDGEVRSIVVRYRVRLDSAGNVVMTHGANQDITNRKRQETALAESEHSYHSLFETIRQALYILDSEGRFIEVNNGAEEMYGYSRAEFTGKTPEFLSAPGKNDLAQVMVSLKKAFAGEPQQFEFWGLRKNGQIFPKDVRLYRGAYFGRDVIIAVGTDISERYAGMEALRESEKRFRLLHENAGIGIGYYTPDGVVISYNQVAAGHMGGDPEDFIGRSIFDLFPKEEADRYFGRIQMAAGSAESAVYEDIVPLPTGNKYFLSTFTRISGSRKDVAGIQIISQEVTGLKRAEIALRESEENYRRLFEAESDAIFLIDNETGRILQANSSAAALYGYGRDELLSMKNTDLSDEEEKTVQVTRDTPIAPDTIVTIPLRWHRKKDGTRLPVEITGRFFVHNGLPVHIAAIRDISERIRSEAALQQANRKLNLLSGVTRHDIRNQLFSLRAFLDLSRESLADPEKMSAFIDLEEEVIATIGHQISFTKEYEDLGCAPPVWQNAGDGVRAAARAFDLTGIGLITEGLDGIEISADPLLKKVFYNLIDNALRHGTGKVSEIRFTSGIRGEDLLLVCSDNGPGIPAEDKEVIFDRGYGRNTGYGLSLIREILAITGISIAESGEYGRGARFEITVPRGVYRYTGLSGREAGPDQDAGVE